MTSPESGPAEHASTPAEHASSPTGGASTPAGIAAHPHWRVLLLAGIAAVVLAIDVVTKVAIVATIAPGENVRILGGLVYLTQIRNAGAAFSMATGMTWVLAIVAIAVVAFIIRMAPRLHSTPWAVCLGLILGGALGNLSDRIFRAPGFLQGHVVDFVSVFGPNAEYFPAFNAADSAITVGGVLLVLIALLGYDFDGRRRGQGRTAPDRQQGAAEPSGEDHDEPAAGGGVAPSGEGDAAPDHGRTDTDGGTGGTGGIGGTGDTGGIGGTRGGERHADG